MARYRRLRGMLLQSHSWLTVVLLLLPLPTSPVLLTTPHFLCWLPLHTSPMLSTTARYSLQVLTNMAEELRASAAGEQLQAMGVTLPNAVSMLQVGRGSGGRVEWDWGLARRVGCLASYGNDLSSLTKYQDVLLGKTSRKRIPCLPSVPSSHPSTQSPSADPRNLSLSKPNPGGRLLRL